MPPDPLNVIHFVVSKFFARGFFDYNVFKLWILAATGLPHSTLHIYAGVGIQLTMCLLLGKRFSHPTPLFFVCFAELINEIRDALYTAGDINALYAAGFIRDWLHTITIPVTIFLLSRYSKLFHRADEA